MKSDRVRRSPSPLLSFFFPFLLFLTFCHTPTEGYVSMLFASYFLLVMRGRMLPSLSTLLKLLEMSRASSDGRTWIVCRCHFPRHFDAYFTGITRVKNGNGDINIRGGVHTWWVARTGAQSPAELRQFNNGTCLIIHSIENNPANRRNNYYRNVTLRHGIISVGAILIIGGTLLPGLTRVITFTWP